MREKSKQQKIEESINSLENSIGKAIRDKDNLIMELNKLKNSKEIMDEDAPRCGCRWSTFDRECLDEKLQDFLFDTAKKLGRSTAAIRFKAMECIMNKLSPERRDNIKSMILQILS